MAEKMKPAGDVVSEVRAAATLEALAAFSDDKRRAVAEAVEVRRAELTAPAPAPAAPMVVPGKVPHGVEVRVGGWYPRDGRNVHLRRGDALSGADAAWAWGVCPDKLDITIP
jgi:hypothetical protein